MMRDRTNEGDAPPSNQANDIRRRKREICNIVHNSTWVIETFILLSSVMIQFLSLRMEPYTAQSVSDTIGLLCARIVVPITSLFAEQRIKVIVMEHGWVPAIKAALKLEHFTRIVPFNNNR